MVNIGNLYTMTNPNPKPQRPLIFTLAYMVIIGYKKAVWWARVAFIRRSSVTLALSNFSHTRRQIIVCS